VVPPVLLDCDVDLVHYQAGADPLKQDRLGRLQLTRTDLHARNALVLESVRAWGVPTVVSMGGGYSRPIEASVRAHGDVFAQASVAQRDMTIRRMRELCQL